MTIKRASVRPFLVLATLLTTMLVTSTAQAVDEKAAKDLFKKNECSKCHDAKKSKKGPSLKKIADKYRDKPDAIEKLIENFTTEPMVELSDGTKEKHKLVNTRDAEKQTNLAHWILSH